MKRITTSWLRCCAVLVLIGANSANSQTAQAIAKKAFGSTVLLVMEDANGQPLSLGSGFFVGAGEIASNLHVVEGAVRGYAKLVGQETKHDLEGITAVDSRRDLVVIKIAVAGSPVLPLSNSDAVQVGEPVYAVGNPQGLEGTFSQGVVSNIREVDTDKLLQITAPISPGSSGGPVLNHKGEVVGVSVATFRGGQNLNFAIPSNYLKLLLEEAGPAKPLAQAKPNKVEHSILADLGGRSSEGVVASHFSWSASELRGSYTFSVRNQLREPVRDVVCLVIFFAHDDLPIETEMVTISGPVGGNLARRSPSLGRLFADEVRNLTAKTEIRILDFRLKEEVVEEVELEEEEEIVELWRVEKKPVIIKKVKPEYPATVQEDNITGKVFVTVLVGKDGKVEQIGKITGPKVFHEVARAAALQSEFTPAMQNDRPVEVWVSLPFTFRMN